ncbi:hypothetical protein [Streptomyces sp. H39-S7]|uniref:hypothetical protein n=1 Tax=Streptomyces sp. H39-S7 TaxID=3004357 RepID=UPI0022B04618|nr:hypothetical protein [Streptomyces sp. H39-S7]MCZ4121559.1 hypothetical protein [Streptomyces sp. H39-S7]
MGKNKNRRNEGQEKERSQAVEAQEQAKNSAAQEQVLPTSEQVSRRQQKRFGHN